MTKVNIARDQNAANTTVTAFFDDGTSRVADSNHANFDEILEAALAGDLTPDLFNLAERVGAPLAAITDQIRVSENELFFDGEVMDNDLADVILDLHRKGAPTRPLGLFLELLMSNPKKHSRKNTYPFLKASLERVTEGHAGFAFSDEGHLIAYKGVKALGNGQYTSISHGTAMVDGVVVHGAIPTCPGSVVEMPRSEVQFEPGVACSTGLHAGSWEYASQFAQGAVVKVAINPRDIVSVPTDCDAQKMRVCRYRVLEVIERPMLSFGHGSVGEDAAPAKVTFKLLRDELKDCVAEFADDYLDDEFYDVEAIIDDSVAAVVDRLDDGGGYELTSKAYDLCEAFRQEAEGDGSLGEQLRRAIRTVDV